MLIDLGRGKGVSPIKYIFPLENGGEVSRKPRLQFAGPIYHVLSRGNYRKERFDHGSARLFEKTLLEASAKCGWLLHAYVIMSNRYHLAVETPRRTS